MTSVDMGRLADTIRKEIEEACKVLLQDPSLFINDKVGRNTLSDSNLRDDARVDSGGYQVYNIYLNFYYEYVQRGRKPFEKRVPIDALRDWAQRKLGKSDNSILYAIQQSIYCYGINPRPIAEPMDRMLEGRFDADWSEMIFSAIIKDIEEYFNGND